jgi:hypothetical protein
MTDFMLAVTQERRATDRGLLSRSPLAWREISDEEPKLKEILVTVLIALGTALFQVIMKGISRTEIPPKKHGLTLDDALFWTDWTLAGCLALIGSIAVATKQGEPPNLGQLWLAFLAIAFGFSGLPWFLRLFAYDSNAKIKQMGWKGLGWIIIANLVGMAILLSAVVTGANVYEW